MTLLSCPHDTALSRAPSSQLHNRLGCPPSQPFASAVRSPVDLLDVAFVEALSIVGTRARSNLAQLRQAYLTKHVAAGKEHLYIIAVVGAASTCHLRLP